MLSDLERKTLRILYNFSNLNRRMPNIKELEKKTGARTANIFSALDGLQKQGYIEWQPRDTKSIKIVNAWEEPPKGALTNTLMGRM
ncbi:MarR family transcriptional regulator [Paenibacillus larvae]|uniref:MarR family transcriptional regulator n=3 Tax=Paenibacillus larvae TaxID=1464 RepID=A0AAP5N197_9BACL|nr:MarR family transcriptional regulator [Paenibacillus larvae]MCY9687679.1 MarR family transcriptional regulator [Paenibacillus larvae]MCY9712557.1 MarR family transcriptional regulator [Paenibacillus larvae]MCY9717824.1 MarR family transcriptional regulator [Paenibacillus larvae]MDT2231198.1 MarR family transcriptional regulator [Paenibacillus larvae]MDT2238284.1 MarR family transcriptional regulator [Paenibacillus larvae]